jgi:hypothetical protein
LRLSSDLLGHRDAERHDRPENVTSVHWILPVEGPLSKPIDISATISGEGGTVKTRLFSADGRAASEN